MATAVKKSTSTKKQVSKSKVVNNNDAAKASNVKNASKAKSKGEASKSKTSVNKSKTKIKQDKPVKSDKKLNMIINEKIGQLLLSFFAFPIGFLIAVTYWKKERQLAILCLLLSCISMITFIAMCIFLPMIT